MCKKMSPGCFGACISPAFVAASSFVLSVLLFALACLHLNYLFEAFVNKQEIQNMVSAGKQLDSYSSLLWCLLYTFGETSWPVDNSPSTISTTHEYELRVWKLSGLVSAYTLAVAVNLGLCCGSSASCCCDRSASALFIPWIIVNFVAVLCFFSLFLGVIIVRLAYSTTNINVDETSATAASGVLAALVPLALAVVLFTYWAVVVRVYLSRINPGEADGEETWRSGDDEQRVSLLVEGVTGSAKKIIKSRDNASRGRQSSSWRICCCQKEKLIEKRTASDDCHDKMLQSFIVQDGDGEKPNSEPTLTNGTVKLVNGEGAYDSSWVSSSPFLPELRQNRGGDKGSNGWNCSKSNGQRSRNNSGEEAPSSEISWPEIQQHNGWSELDSREADKEPIRRFSRRRRQQQQHPAVRRLNIRNATTESKSVRFKDEMSRIRQSRSCSFGRGTARPIMVEEGKNFQTQDNQMIWSQGRLGMSVDQLQT